MLYLVEFSSPINDSCEVSLFSVGTRFPAIAGGIARTAQVRDVQFSKSADSLTCKLMQYYATGTRFSTVTIKSYRHAKGAVFMSYKCSDVVIDSMHSDSLGESIGLNCGSIKESYFG